MGMTSRARSRPTRPGLARALATRLGVVEVGRREDSLHGPAFPRQPDQGAGVDPLDADDAVLLEIVGQRTGRAVIADPAAQLADHEAADPGPPALGILGVDPVVADLRIGHRHDLTVIRGVGQDLLIAGHARVEDDLAVALTAGTKGRAREYRAVLEREFRDVHGRFRSSPPAPASIRRNIWKSSVRPASTLRRDLGCGGRSESRTKIRASMISV